MNDKIQQMFLMKRPWTEICDCIAKFLIDKYNFKTIPGKKMNEIYFYKDGIFVNYGKDIIEEETEKILDSSSKNNLVNEIKSKIERKTKVSREEFTCKDKNLICLNNGVLNIFTKELHEYSEKYKFTNKLPVSYNPDAHCDRIFKFFSEVLIDEDISCIQEWFGFQLYREYNIKKAAIFRGGPDTGKTTFMNLLENFVGKENCANISLQLIAQGKWHILPLYRKYSNICDDLSEKDITDSGTFKQITGRSPLDAEVKFGDHFSFENYAKLSFACNKIPAINSDVDDVAYWDRWIIFDFENVFEKNNEKTDTKIIHKLTTTEELSGLLNWALEGLIRLQKKGHFSYRRNWEDNRKIMQGETSTVARFVNECLLYDANNWISNKEIYDSYSDYCELNDITRETEQKFAKDIRKYCNFGKFGANKGNIFGIRGIKIRDILPFNGV